MTEETTEKKEISYFCDSTLYRGAKDYLTWHVPKYLVNLLNLKMGTKVAVYVNHDKKEIILKIKESETNG